jgi:hypothetical protein
MESASPIAIFTIPDAKLGGTDEDTLLLALTGRISLPPIIGKSGSSTVPPPENVEARSTREHMEFISASANKTVERIIREQ